MRIAIAQIDPAVGAFEANRLKIEEAYGKACAAGARILLTPELVVSGYPPHDLLERPEIFSRTEAVLAHLAAITQGRDCALVLGHVTPNPEKTGRLAQNVVSVYENGKLVHRQPKMLLPTYDVFDEARYFEPASRVAVWNCDGIRVALAICEDLWAQDSILGRRLYGTDPVAQYRDAGVDLILSASASPFEWGKPAKRLELHAEVARSLGAPLVYVNQTCATDEILFDGSSFAMDSKGVIQGRLPFFKTAFGLVEVDELSNGGGTCRWVDGETEDQAPPEIELVLRGLVLGIREYFSKTGFKSAVLGLSGGIDSAVVAALAAKALGPSNVLGVAMPSQYSSGHSLADAESLAANLGIRFEVKPIKFLYSVASRQIAEGVGELNPIALENLQSRLRGLILMTLSNHGQALVLTTGNKSELATGYCTQYGDMVGAIAPIGDLYKTRVYELARHINAVWGAPIPESSITKPPSAELAPGQKDEDSLPPYASLDALLEDYLEKRLPVDELEKRHGSASQPRPGSKTGSWVRDILRLLELTEFKRRQAAPVLKVTPKAFGIGRRIPLAKTWDQ